MKCEDMIRDLMEEKKISYADLEHMTGIARGTLHNYITGKTEMPLSRLKIIANVLNVSPEYLIGWSNVKEYPVGNLVRFPVIASVKCGFGKDIEEELPGIYTEIPVSDLRGYPQDECKVIRAEGESMMPYILPGDKVLIHLQDDADTGDLALVATNTDGEATLKKIRKEANLLELIPMNEDYPAITYRGKSLANVHIFGKALKVIRDL